MDRTAELASLVNSLNGDNGGINTGTLSSPSPYILMASTYFSQMVSMRKFLESIFDGFVDYNRHMRKGKDVMDDVTRNKLDNEMGLFAGTCGILVAELSQYAGENLNAQHAAHYEEVVVYLQEFLRVFSKRILFMKRERLVYQKDPFHLLLPEVDTNSEYRGQSATSFSLELVKLDTDMPPNQKVMNEKKNDAIKNAPPLPGLFARPGESQTSAKEGLGASTVGTIPTATNSFSSLPSSFAERYDAEIAPPKKMKEYENMASTHRDVLFKEAKQLQVNFSSDLKETNQMENTVEQISSMLSEFSHIVQTQTPQVAEVRDHGKEAADLVQQTSDQLKLTIDRSKFNQQAMTFVILLLSVLLVLLDWITP